jgi:hypothetical protein
MFSEKWLKTIKDNKGADNIELKKWEKEPAKHYSEIFSQRFRANASACLVLVRICAKNK